MHMDAVREIVLAERDGEAPRADRLSELQNEGILLGHAGRLGRCYFPLYYLIDRLPIGFISRKLPPSGDVAQGDVAPQFTAVLLVLGVEPYRCGRSRA